MAKKIANRKKVSARRTVARNSRGNMGLAIVALVLNILILPGLGSLISGKAKEGIWQLVLALAGIILFYVSLFIGLPVFLVGWIWGIVTGVRLVKESQ